MKTFNMLNDFFDGVMYHRRCFEPNWHMLYVNESSSSSCSDGRGGGGVVVLVLPLYYTGGRLSYGRQIAINDK